jgi:ribonucleotide reductase alpha subunit
MTTSQITVDLITLGLDAVDPMVKKHLAAPYDSEQIQNLAKRLGTDVVNYDNYRAAGRLLMYNAIRASSTDIRRYVKTLNHRLNKVCKQFMLDHADTINAAISERRHLDYTQHDLMSASSLVNIYLLTPAYEEDPAETPQQHHMRQAVQFYHKTGIHRVLQAYRQMSDEEYTHASPTRFNAGTVKAQMGSCFLLTIGDNLESILYQGVGDSGMISKDNGGLGLNLQYIRHSEIAYSGKSSGLIPFARVYNATIKSVNQGGKRDGAATLFARDFHIDVEDLIKSTDNFTNHELRLTDANTCLWMSRLFFKRVETGGQWTTFCPARASELNELYGYELEEAYCRLEVEAAIKDREYQALIAKVHQLKNDLLTDPEDEELRDKYERTLHEKLEAKKRLITHKVVDANALYTLIVTTQVRSSMPYIMHGDAVNYKCNQKNLGPVGSSNLCLEVTERSTPEEIASCNLASMNLRYYVQGVIDWRAALVSYAELCSAYNFKGLGRSIGSVVENLDEVIEQNDYPLDERDPITNVVTKRGKISIPNLRNRPLGIGASGLFDAGVETDLCYDSPGMALLNKMIFACMYWNALVKSMEMAIRVGPYETFRTGSYNRYRGSGRWQQCFGSPLSNGQFQFDLWQEDAQLLSDNGDLNEEIYNRDDDIPLEPTTWGQEATRIKCTDYNGNHVDIIVEPSWDALRPLIMRYGVRHSLLIALMPTASSAQAIRNTESTEGHQAVLYTRSVIHGNFTIVVPQLIKDLKEIGLWTEKLTDFIMACEGSVKYIHHYIADKPEDFPEANFVTDEDGRKVLPKEMLDRLRYIQRKYQTMYELSQKIPIRHARQRGVYVCQSQSLNIYAQDATEEQLKAIHSYTNKMGLKTGMYYLRQNPAKFTGQFTIDPLMLKYTQTLLQTMNIPKHIRASSVQNSISKDVCEMKPGCVSCN